MNIHDQDIYFKAKNEGIFQGFQQGAYEKAIETAKNMILYGDSVEKISKVTGLDINLIKDLTKSII